MRAPNDDNVQDPKVDGNPLEMAREDVFLAEAELEGVIQRCLNKVPDRAEYLTFFSSMSKLDNKAAFLALLARNNGVLLFRLIPDIEALLLFIDTLAYFADLRDYFYRSDCIKLICDAYVNAMKPPEMKIFKDKEMPFLLDFFKQKDPLGKLTQLIAASKHPSEGQKPYEDEELRVQRRLLKLIAAPAAAPAFVGSAALAAAPAPRADASALPKVVSVNRERLVELAALFTDPKGYQKQEIAQIVCDFLQRKRKEAAAWELYLADFVGSRWFASFCSDKPTLISCLHIFGEAGILEQFNKLGGFGQVVTHCNQAMIEDETSVVAKITKENQERWWKDYATFTDKAKVYSWITGNPKFWPSAAVSSAEDRSLYLYVDCSAIWPQGKNERPNQEFLNKWYGFLRRLHSVCELVFFRCCYDFKDYFELVGRGNFWSCDLDDKNLIRHLRTEGVLGDFEGVFRIVLAVAPDSKFKEIPKKIAKCSQKIVLSQQNPALFDQLDSALQFEPMEVEAAVPQDPAVAPAALPKNSKKKKNGSKKNAQNPAMVGAAPASVGSAPAPRADALPDPDKERLKEVEGLFDYADNDREAVIQRVCNFLHAKKTKRRKGVDWRVSGYLSDLLSTDWFSVFCYNRKTLFSFLTALERIGVLKEFENCGGYQEVLDRCEETIGEHERIIMSKLTPEERQDCQKNDQRITDKEKLCRWLRVDPELSPWPVFYVLFGKKPSESKQGEAAVPECLTPAEAPASVGSALAAAPAPAPDVELTEHGVIEAPGGSPISYDNVEAGPPGGLQIFHSRLGGAPGGLLFEYDPGSDDSESDEPAGAYRHK